MSLISFASADFFPLASSHFFRAALIVVGIFSEDPHKETKLGKTKELAFAVTTGYLNVE